MKRKYYEIGDVFKDEDTGKMLKVKIEDTFYCQECFYGDKECGKVPECRGYRRKDMVSVYFEEVKSND